jgi:hypothetical protein
MYIKVDVLLPGSGPLRPGDLQNTPIFPSGRARLPGDSGMRLSTTVKRGAVLSKEAAAGMISGELKAGAVVVAVVVARRTQRPCKCFCRALTSYVCSLLQLIQS